MDINYTVSFPHPHTHYAEVALTISGCKETDIALYMPVWTPGSYLIREFSRHVESWQCNAPAKKISKNTWHISNTKDKEIQIRYRVYANEMSVRTSFIDAGQAYINGASVFMAVEGSENSPVQVKFIPHKDWQTISTALEMKGEDVWTRTACDFDELVDSPVLISNHKVLKFKAGGVPHQVALEGESNMEKTLFLHDLKAICEQEIKLFGRHPCKQYLFIIHHTLGNRGGLEHMNSSSNIIHREGYTKGESYHAAMSLLAHEYFHLWNGKRIRPEELGPFDYNKENYTSLLWVIEGITSYYDDYFTYLAGVESREEYLEIVAKNISGVVNRPGDRVQSLSEASFDTWIKYYRQNENSHNSQVNYYTKGAAVVLALNFLILHESKGELSMNDVMRALYIMYLERPERGYTEQEIQDTFESAAGISLKSFFDQHIYGTEPVDYAAYFAFAGLELYDRNERDSIQTAGWQIEKTEGRYIIKRVDRDTGAYLAGINVNDELIAINGHRAGDKYEKFVAECTPDNTIDVTIARQGILQTIPVKIGSGNARDYRILENPDATPLQKLLRKKWLGEA